MSGRVITMATDGFMAGTSTTTTTTGRTLGESVNLATSGVRATGKRAAGEGIPPSDADRPPAAPRVVQEEEDKTSALIPTLPLVTSPPPSLPELDSESHRSFREALQGENVLVPSDVSSHLDSDRSHRTTSQNSRNQRWPMPPDVLAREMGGKCAKRASARACPPNERSGTECAKATF